MHKIHSKTSNHNSKFFVPVDQIYSHTVLLEENNRTISRVHASQVQKSIGVGDWGRGPGGSTRPPA